MKCVLPKLWHMRFKPASPDFLLYVGMRQFNWKSWESAHWKDKLKCPPVSAKETSTRCAMQCVWVCGCIYTCMYCMLMCPLLFGCKHWWKTREIWRQRREEQATQCSCLSSSPTSLQFFCIYCNVLLFLIKFCSHFVHVCQLLLLSLSSLNVLHQIIFFLGLYLLFYFKVIVFCIVVRFYVFYLCTTLTVIRYTYHQSCPMLFFKGLALDIMLV